MKTCILGLAAALALCPFANAQSVEAKIKALQDSVSQIVTTQTEQGQQLNGISAVQARMQSDIADLKQEIAELKSMVKAMSTASGTTLTKTSTPGWNGTTTFTATAPQSVGLPPMVPAPTFMQGYGSGMMMSSGAGGCAGGSCGSGGSRGRMGVFGRRR